MPANSPTPSAGRWQAGFAERQIYPKRRVEKPDGEIKIVSRPLTLLYVTLDRGDGEQIAFCVSWPKGRLVFSDNRECHTGTAGSTGQWGTHSPSKAGKRRTLTPTAWKVEVSRLIGMEKAEQIVRILSNGNPFF